MYKNKSQNFKIKLLILKKKNYGSVCKKLNNNTKINNMIIENQ